jgi:MFS family permease
MLSEKAEKASRITYVVIAYFGLFVIAVTATLMGPAFPSVMEQFHVPFGLVGVLASAWSLGYLLTSVGGMLSDRYGELTVIGVSFAVTGIAAGLVSVAPSFEALICLFLLGGIGAALGEAAMNPLISKMYPERSGFALNLLHFFFSLGAFFGPVFAGLMIAHYENWRLPFSVSSLAFIPLVVLTGITLRKSRPTKAREKDSIAESSSESSLGEIFMRGRLLALAGFFYLGTELATSVWLPTFLSLERNLPIELASIASGLFWAAMAGGRLALGSVTDRFGYKRIIMLCSVLGTLLIVMGAVAENAYLLIVLWSILGFVFGPIMPTIFAWVSKLFPSRRGTATGIIYSTAFLGAVFLPWILGALAQLYSMSIAIFFLAFSALAICLSILPFRSEQHETAVRS